MAPSNSNKKPSCCWHGRPYCPSRKTNQTKDRHTFKNWSGSRPGSWTTVPQSINCALLVPSGHWPVPSAGHVAMQALWSRLKFIARRQLNATVHMQTYGRRLLQFGTQAFSHKYCKRITQSPVSILTTQSDNTHMVCC